MCRTWMLPTCPQQVMHIGLFVFGEWYDTHTNRKHYSTADHRLINQCMASWTGTSPDILAASFARMLAVSSRMWKGCYEETAPVEFKIYPTHTAFLRKMAMLCVYDLEMSSTANNLAEMFDNWDNQYSRCVSWPPRWEPWDTRPPASLSSVALAASSLPRWAIWPSPHSHQPLPPAPCPDAIPRRTVADEPRREWAR